MCNNLQNFSITTQTEPNYSSVLALNSSIFIHPNFHQNEDIENAGNDVHPIKSIPHLFKRKP